MKVLWKQMLIALISFSICFQSYGQQMVCSSVFLNDKLQQPNTFLEKWFLPRAILNFDHDLYWKVRTSDIKSLNLTSREMKSLEVKLGLIDRLIPKNKNRWANQLPQFNVLRQRQLNSLVSRFSLENLQDPYLRKQFITQLYLLNETPWMGFKKSLDFSLHEKVQDWVERGLDEYLLNQGLEVTLRQFVFSDPTRLEKAKLYTKKLFANKWFKFPRSLPVLSKNLEDPFIKEVLSESVGFEDPRLVSLMRKNHLIDNYNRSTQVYQRVGVFILTILVYMMFVQQQEEAEKKIKEKLLEMQNDPEYIKKQNEAFAKAMSDLDRIDGVLDQISVDNSADAAFQETVLLFEQVNKRQPTLDEQQKIHSSLEKPN